MEYPSILDFLGGQGGRLHKAVGEVGIIHAVHEILTPNRAHPRSVLGLEGGEWRDCNLKPGGNARQQELL